MNLPFENIKPITVIEMSELKKIDVFFCLGNEVVPPHEPIGIKNVYICQFPFSIENKSDLLEKRRLWIRGYDRIITYSTFSKNHYQEQLVRYGLGDKVVDIINPPTNTYEGEVGKKKRNMIISVGRFFRGVYTKGHMFMISAFKTMIDDYKIDAELHLVGSLHPESAHRQYYLECKKLAKGYPIFFHTDASSSKLEGLYFDSNIYWHATGVDADEKTSPENMEHFGISIVEAMSYGCIPVVFGKGGPVEIVENEKSGFHFFDADELVEKSKSIISNADSVDSATMRKSAILRSKIYDEDAFEKRVLDFIEHLK
jgi:glycosyltransferase involved in cell wall biosynthesis